MNAPRRLRLSALLAGVAVIAASVLPAFPAAAEEPPAPDPVVTSEPLETPAAEATETPEPEPSDTPAAEPTPTEAPTAEPTAEAAVGAIEYTGTFAAIADETEAGPESTRRLFQVNGQGFLSVDTTGYSRSALLGTRVVTFQPPAGLTLSTTEATRFTQLATASASTPLTIVSTRPALFRGKQTASLVNQTPNAPATHRIYAVLVSPNSAAIGANQTAAKVVTSVTHADDYWSQQSGGTIGFDLVGTVPWYKSTYSCHTEAGSVALWNQAAALAKTKLGYVAGKNNHLALFFPSTFNCATGIGLGTVGDSANSGGMLWVTGTDAPMEQATLAHELGHNMSLGHADWLECALALPSPGFTGTGGCARHEYGDVTDVMGIGTPGTDGGALSSPQAIRSSIWPGAAWETMPVGTTSRTINTVASNSGLRALVVQDNNGVNYFVEYRNFDGEDAQYSGETCPDASLETCGATTGGVRVLRLEDNTAEFGSPVDLPNGFLGFPGDDTLLMGRTVAFVDRANLTNGEIWWSQGGSGIKVTVTAVTATTATVQIIKSANSATADPAFYVYPSSTYDNNMRVGDTWTALAGGSYDAQTTTFQWYRGTVDNVQLILANEIPGATAQNYTLTAADIGKYIRVVMNGSSTVGTTFNVDPDVGGLTPHAGYGPIITGVYLVDDPGTVSIDNSATPLVATPASWPVGTTFGYQWYRGLTATTATTAIVGSGANTANYTPTSADVGRFLRVRVTASVPGFAAVARYSAAKDYSIKNTVLPTLLGTPKVGTELTSSFLPVYTTVDGTLPGVMASYQWLRNGVAIAGNPDATDDGDYTLTSADYLAKISLRITGVKGGWVSNVVTSAAMTISQKGTFVSGGPAAVMQTGLNNLTLQVGSALTDVTPAATSMTYQWYRNGVAVVGKTATTYGLTSADYGKTVIVKVTYLRSNYTSLTVAGNPGGSGQYWLRPNEPVTFTGPQMVTGTLEYVERTYTDMRDGSTVLVANVTQSRKWLRSGVAVVGATGLSYLLGALDKGKSISLTVTASAADLLPSVATSAATPAIGVLVLPGSHVATPILDLQTATSTDFITIYAPGSTGIDSPNATPNTVAYQWYRDGVAIVGATKLKYTLTQADRDHDVWVRIVTSHGPIGATTYTTVVQYSEHIDQGIYALAGPVVNVYTLFATGGELAAIVPTYTNASGDPISGWSQTYQWYRTAVVAGILTTTAIPALQGGTSGHYFLKAADVGATIKVKVTTGKFGYIPHIATYTTTPSTLKVVKGALVGTSTPPTVIVDNPAINSLGAIPPVVTGTLDFGTPPNATFTYQWLRNGAAIVGATLSRYKLTSLDSGKNINVRVTANLAGYNSAVLPLSTPLNYTITLDGDPNHVPRVSGSNWIVGEGVGLYDYADFATKDGPLASPVIAIQWLRSGVAIPLATNSNYFLVAADYGKLITARVTVSKPGYLPLVFTAPAGPVIGKGITEPGATVVVVPGTGLGTVKAQVDSLAPSMPAPTYTYKWYRANPATPATVTLITGATLAQYALTSLDFNKLISVQVTMTRTNFTVPVTAFPRTAGVDYSIRGDGPAGLSGTPTVGHTLTATPPTFLEADNTTTLVETPTLTYTWYRSGVAVVGPTTDQYVLTGLDLGKVITVRATAKLPGRLARTSAPSTATTPVAIGTFDLGTYHPTVSMTNVGTRTMTVAFGGTINSPAGPYTVTYQWYRHATSDLLSAKVPIALATLSSYKLTSADTGKLVTVVVKIAKSGFTTHTFPELEVNSFSQGEPAVIVGAPAVGFVIAGAPPNYYLASGAWAQNGVNGTVITYQWTKDGVPIVGETSDNYLVDAGDSGTQLRFVVTVSAPYHATRVEPSAPVAVP